MASRAGAARRGQRGGVVKPRQDADEGKPVALGHLIAEVPGHGIDGGEDRDGIPLARRGERLPPGGVYRRDGELQPCLAQRDDGLHRGLQVGVPVRRAGAAPAACQFGDRDEPMAARCFGELPVVIAEPHRQVTQPAGGKIPLLAQGVRQSR
jgi:hypothetical protein